MQNAVLAAENWAGGARCWLHGKRKGVVFAFGREWERERAAVADLQACGGYTTVGRTIVAVARQVFDDIGGRIRR